VCSEFYLLGPDINEEASSRLIFIDLRLLELGLPLLLEGDDDQGHEDVDKEEGKDDEVNNVENGHLYPENRNSD
jgi:hypothetical protein